MHRTLSRIRQLPRRSTIGVLLALGAAHLAFFLCWPAGRLLMLIFTVPEIILCSLLLPRGYAFVIAGTLGTGATWLSMHHPRVEGTGLATTLVFGTNLAGGLLASLLLAWLTSTTNDDFAFLEATGRDTQEFVYLIDSDGRVAYINAAGAGKLGYTPAEMIGERMHRYIPGWEWATAVKALHATFAQQGPVPMRVHLLGRSGEELTLTAIHRPAKWKRQTYALGIGQDVTSMERSDRLFTAAFDAISASLAIRTTEGEILCSNRAFAASVGKSKCDLIGSAALAYGLDPSHSELLKLAIVTGSPQQAELQTPDGKTVSGNVFPIFNEHGIPTAVITLANDITATKQAEATLLQTARLAAVGQLAAGLAHNINNILAAISVSAELLQLQPEEAGTQVSADILRAVDRGSEMVQKLYRLSGGGEPPKVERLPVAEVFQGVVQMIQTRLIMEDIELVQDIPADAIVYADASLLHQVLMNLVINAIQAMTHGEGCLTISARSTGNQWAELRVADNGCGIPPDHLDRIFTPFFTTKGSANGTGLGLSTSLRMVNSMGGDLKVESRPGKGATFTIRLPTYGKATPG